MIDMNFINFFIRTKYDLSLEEYYNVQKSTVSNWRKRKIPKKYIDNFSNREGSDNIYKLFQIIYPI